MSFGGVCGVSVDFVCVCVLWVVVFVGLCGLLLVVGVFVGCGRFCGFGIVVWVFVGFVGLCVGVCGMLLVLWVCVCLGCFCGGFVGFVGIDGVCCFVGLCGFSWMLCFFLWVVVGFCGSL